MSEEQSCLRRIWGRCLKLGSVASLVVVGVLLWAGFTAAVEWTNRTEFCIACHEMQANSFSELKESVHWTNASGVRAQCADCHVPQTFGAKMMRKLWAANDVYHHILGTVDTPDKFESKRAELAERVWAYMRASDSRECKSCHGFQAMNLEKQPLTPKNKHAEAMKTGKTCVDCHQGVAHRLPLPDD